MLSTNMVVLLLTLLPWPLVWYGMYKAHSMVASFALYHGICLLPALIHWRRLWLPLFKPPTLQQLLFVCVAGALSTACFVFVYKSTGDLIISREHVLHQLAVRGFKPDYLLPLTIYFLTVNPIFEELFWRGVIFNKLAGSQRGRTGAAWAVMTFGGWHWLVLRTLVQPGWAEVAILGIMLMGAVMAWLYRRTDSITVPILWHSLVFDLPIIAILATLLRSPAPLL